MYDNKQKILIVEDEIDFRNVIKTILTESGYEIFMAENGYHGLEVAKKVIPDLILCDIQMPSMNGYELLNAVKMEPALGEIPFVFMTGVNTGQFDLRKGMDLGADDYLTKPFSMDDLISAVQTRLQKKQSWQKFFDSKVEKIQTGFILLLSNELNMLVMDILENSQFLIQDKSVSSDMVQRTAKMINLSGKRLGHLHENILLYSMLQLWVNDEEKIASLRQETTILYLTVLNSIINENTNAMERRKTISIKCTDANILISPAFFGKIIDELIDNACKFSEPGSNIYITSEENQNELRLVIRDQGRGMSKQEIENIESLFQNDRQANRHQEVGLGLTIAKTIAELHGGNLSIESLESIGTIVKVSFLKAVNI
jgi:two-component system sensor histidine kinase/response regulator